MQILTLSNFKGGCGKSTSATHIAAGLAIKGKRVVLVDGDPQAHATLMFGLQEEPGLYDLLVRNASFEKVLRPVHPQVYAPDGNSKGELFVVPSNVETRSIPLHITDPFIMHRRMHQLDNWADIVIVDTSPTPSLLQTVIFVATDGMIYPTKCEALSFDGLNKSLGFREEAQPMRQKYGLSPVALVGIIPTMYRASTIEHTQLYDALKENFGDRVWRPIPQRTVWAEASRLRQPVFAVAPDTQAAKDAWYLVHKVSEAVNL